MYVINLERRPERKRTMIKRLTEIGCIHKTIFLAVYLVMHAFVCGCQYKAGSERVSDVCCTHKCWNGQAYDAKKMTEEEIELVKVVPSQEIPRLKVCY